MKGFTKVKLIWKKNVVEWLYNTDFNTDYKSYSNQDNVTWHQHRQIDQWNRWKNPEIDFQQQCKDNSVEKE